ncbi:hypothetical protein ACFTWF_43240 [Rhodococcus sp. NPDC056960]|uniref:hypothetical protein n=1 Tax=Rhodococcus sp. NPDC056960 TaxID=3345982 RepID=UPI00362DB291
MPDEETVGSTVDPARTLGTLLRGPVDHHGQPVEHRTEAELEHVVEVQIPVRIEFGDDRGGTPSVRRRRHR